MNRSRQFAVAIAAALALAAGSAVQAQSQEPSPDEREPTLKDIMDLVEAAMPPVIGDNNTGLVQNLMGVELAKVPLSKGFSYPRARAAVFGPRITPNLDRDCARTLTSAGVPSEGDCIASLGDENGNKPYTALEFSKNMGFGNVRVLKRPDADDLPNAPEDLKAVEIPDVDVYQKGLEFLAGSLGLPLDEIQVAPNQEVVPVRHLQIGFDPQAKLAPITIQKVVYLQRGLKLPSPLKDPANGFEMTHVPAPGMARVAFDATGQVVGAMIRDWQDLARNPNVTPDLAKNRRELVDEISADLLKAHGGPIGTLKILIGMTTDFQGTHGLLLPAVQVYVAPGGKDTQPPSQTTGAYIREYQLVDLKEGESQDR